MRTEIHHIKENVHEACGKETMKVQADIDKNIYNYFFMHVIAYSHGSRQAMVTFFFQRLFEQCIEEGIPPVWDEKNGEKLLEILNRLNFNKPTHE